MDGIGVRISTLDDEVRNAHNNDTQEIKLFADVEPWNNEVDGAKLLDEIRKTLQQFIICDENITIAATLWIAFTWFIDDVSVSPLAIITAPEKRCGKTQLLSFMGKLVRRPFACGL